jgi:hypothetical protein
VIDLEGERRARGAVQDRNAEGLAVKRVPRIDDGDGLDGLVLAVFAARGIKKIPRSTACTPWYITA